MPTKIHSHEMPEFLCKKFLLSDPETETKITSLFNQGYWIENILSNEDNAIIIFAKLKDEPWPETENIN